MNFSFKTTKPTGDELRAQAEKAAQQGRDNLMKLRCAVGDDVFNIEAAIELFYEDRGTSQYLMVHTALDKLVEKGVLARENDDYRFVS